MTTSQRRTGKVATVAVAALLCGLFGAVLPARAATTVASFTPTEDTFITSGAPATAYGSYTYSVVDDNPRTSLIKFDVEGLPAGATATATLTLHGDNHTQTAQQVDVRSVGNTWTEATTYNTAPALGAVLASGTLAQNSPVTVTVPVTGNGIVSYAVTRSTAGGDQLFYTSEYSNAALRPTLAVSYDNGGGTTNQAPTVNAGPDVAVTLPASAALNGTVTDDGLPAGSTVTAAWTQVSGPGTTTFANAKAAATTATFSAAGSYVLRLTGSDGTLSASDDVTVTASTSPPPSSSVTKVLTFVEENHSLSQMESGMPYTYGLAKQYGYATKWTAAAHPSLPNYLALATGSTQGVTDDNPPSSHKINAQSVFGQAIAAGKTAKTYAESMTSNCQLTASGAYAVKHNPWAYETPTAERSGCNANDVPETALSADITNGTLPNVGMVVPNLNNDAHDGSLATADNWFKARLQAIMAGPDWKSGHLVVILTADEDNGSSGNAVLTAVIHPSQSAHVVSTPLTHYSWTRFVEDVAHAPHLLNAATAPDMATAFGLTIG